MPISKYSDRELRVKLGTSKDAQQKAIAVQELKKRGKYKLMSRRRK